MGKRIGAVIRQGVGAIGQVHNSDISTVRVLVLNDPVKRRDHLGNVDGTVASPNLYVDDPRFGSDTSGQCSTRSVTGDYSGHVRAVTMDVAVLHRR